MSDYIQGNRYYPEGVSDRFGKHDNDFALHLIDILDWFHPEDPAHYGTVMKDTQAMITTAESGIEFVGHTKKRKKLKSNKNTPTSNTPKNHGDLSIKENDIDFGKNVSKQV